MGRNEELMVQLERDGNSLMGINPSSIILEEVGMLDLITESQVVKLGELK